MLSIVIVNWNSREFLRSCLDSITKHPAREPFEVIVVENASTDGSAAMVRAHFPSVQLLEFGANVGYARGNNLGIAQATGDWILTLNPDTVVPAGALDAAIDRLSDNPGFAVLGARLMGNDGVVQRSVRGFPTLAGVFGDLTGLGKLFPRSRLGSYRQLTFDYGVEGPAEQPMGTFLLFRRSVLEATEGWPHPFDEQFPIFFNEVDLLYRMSLRGHRCLYSPAVTIEHAGGASTRQVRPNMIWESHRSLARYVRKHLVRGFARIFLPLFDVLIYGGAYLRARGYHAGFRPVD